MENYRKITKTESAKQASLIAASIKIVCSHCEKLITKCGIKRHEDTCVKNPKNIKYCPTCNKQILLRKNRYCDSACSAIFNRNSSKRVKKSFVCINCGKNGFFNSSSKGLYCSNQCQTDYEWETKTKPSILKGDRGGKSRVAVRRFLIERDGPQCSDCGITEWNEKPIVMDVDHIDGNHLNCMPDNFRLLCPNCHRQTPTWGKKNAIKYGSTSLRYDPNTKTKN